nr:MAG TPA: hypothetical protein [Caudoviricetes sp.]
MVCLLSNNINLFHILPHPLCLQTIGIVVYLG